MVAFQSLEVRTEREDALATVYVAGEVDYGTASQLRASLVDLAHGGFDAVVDLTGVTFIDSTGLSVLVQAKQRFESTGNTLSVTGAQPRVARVLELSGLTGYLTGA